MFLLHIFSSKILIVIIIKKTQSCIKSLIKNKTNILFSMYIQINALLVILEKCKCVDTLRWYCEKYIINLSESLQHLF